MDLMNEFLDSVGAEMDPMESSTSDYFHSLVCDSSIPVMQQQQQQFSHEHHPSSVENNVEAPSSGVTPTEGGAAKCPARTPRSSSSSYAPNSTSISSNTPSPPRKKKKEKQAHRHRNKEQEQEAEQVAPPARGGNSVVLARFQCRVCGLTRFLRLTQVGLPTRLCECGSSSVHVMSWLRILAGDEGLTGGGLGRECIRCERCDRLYGGELQLRRHNCRRQKVRKDVLQSVENAPRDSGQDYPGIREPPSCSFCSETFIYDSLLSRHIRRKHALCR